MTLFREYLAIVQDDADWLALIDQDDVAHALPLPRSPGSGTRIFSSRIGTKHENFDLEACIVVPGRNGPELIGLGSGSHRGREWILRVHESERVAAVLSGRATQDRLHIDITAEFLAATRFYDALRATREFAGAGLNVEGAVMIGDDTIRLFQRGNAPAKAADRAIDASADSSWRALAEHLAEPDASPPPELKNIERSCGSIAYSGSLWHRHRTARRGFLYRRHDRSCRGLVDHVARARHAMEAAVRDGSVQLGRLDLGIDQAVV